MEGSNLQDAALEMDEPMDAEPATVAAADEEQTRDMLEQKRAVRFTLISRVSSGFRAVASSEKAREGVELHCHNPFSLGVPKLGLCRSAAGGAPSSEERNRTSTSWRR